MVTQDINMVLKYTQPKFLYQPCHTLPWCWETSRVLTVCSCQKPSRVLSVSVHTRNQSINCLFLPESIRTFNCVCSYQKPVPSAAICGPTSCRSRPGRQMNPWRPSTNAAMPSVDIGGEIDNPWTLTPNKLENFLTHSHASFFVFIFKY